MRSMRPSSTFATPHRNTPRMKKTISFRCFGKWSGRGLQEYSRALTALKASTRPRQLGIAKSRRSASAGFNKTTSLCKKLPS